MKARLLLLIALSLTAGLPLSQEPKHLPRAERELMAGTMRTAESHISLFAWQDEFQTDSRRDYRIESVYNQPLNELDYQPLDNHAGVFYTAEPRALFIEAGPGDRTQIARDIPSLEALVIEFTFTPLTVYPDNGLTFLTLYNAGKQQALFAIPGHMERPVYAETAGKDKPITHTSTTINGYSGIARLGGPAGEQADRYDILEPQPITVTLALEKGNYRMQIDGKDIINCPQDQSVPITGFAIGFKNQEGRISRIRCAALSGTFVSRVIETGRPAPKVTLDLIAESAHPELLSISANVAASKSFKEILLPLWSALPEKTLRSFPADISALYTGNTYIKYRLNLNIPADYILKHKTWELPVIKTIAIRKSR